MLFDIKQWLKCGNCSKYNKAIVKTTDTRKQLINVIMSIINFSLICQIEVNKLLLTWTLPGITESRYMNREAGVCHLRCVIPPTILQQTTKHSLFAVICRQV